MRAYPRLVFIAAVLAGCSGDGPTAASSGTTGAGPTGGDATSGGINTGSSAPGTSTSTDEDTSSGSSGEAEPLPDALPFELVRKPDGDPPTAEEITAFTREITGLWAQVDYFRWVSRHGHGLHPSYDPAMPSYKLWWQGTLADKSGDVVTFRHYGGADNIMIRTPKILNQSLMGYLTSGDEVMGKLSADFSDGAVALFRGMVLADEDPFIESITARAIFTHNHSYTTEDGLAVAVDYDPIKVKAFDWNAHTVPNTGNPYYGDIWVRNMRSKDDVPHMYRLVPVLLRAAQDAQDPTVQAAAAQAAEFLQAFAQDIIDSGYRIRSKEDGEIFTPTENLAIFSTLECPGRLSTNLVATGETLELDCMSGFAGDLEQAVIGINYFNRAIATYFHLAAITAALVHRQDDVAYNLLLGLVERSDWQINAIESQKEFPAWTSDTAAILLASGASGLPLTAREARRVMDEYTLAVAHYETYERWDMWAASVPDGEYEYLPSRTNSEGRTLVRPEELTFLIEYCASPWKNPTTIEMVDCEVVLDPTRWGT